MRKLIIPYLLILLLVINLSGALIYMRKIFMPGQITEIAIYCVLFGMLGGMVQCFRGYYLHSAVYKDWDDNWNVWYYVRPIVSGILGLVSLIFLKAGLFVFSAEPKLPTEIGNAMAYIAVAFIAGYNVQNFLTKLEEISKTTLGIGRK